MLRILFSMNLHLPNFPWVVLNFKSGQNWLEFSVLNWNHQLKFDYFKECKKRRAFWAARPIFTRSPREDPNYAPASLNSAPRSSNQKPRDFGNKEVHDSPRFLFSRVSFSISIASFTFEDMKPIATWFAALRAGGESRFKFQIQSSSHCWQAAPASCLLLAYPVMTSKEVE